LIGLLIYDEAVEECPAVHFYPFHRSIFDKETEKSALADRFFPSSSSLTPARVENRILQLRSVERRANSQSGAS